MKSRAEYQREWRAANIERQRQIQRDYYARNRSAILVSQREARVRRTEPERLARMATIAAWKAANPEKVLGYQRAYTARHGKDGHRRNRYNLSPEKYRDFLIGQAGRCAICGQVPPRSLVVDHDHVNGTFRALLCHHCNVMLGAARDDPERLASGIQYLKSFMGAPR